MSEKPEQNYSALPESTPDENTPSGEALPSDAAPRNSEIADGRAESTRPNDKTPNGEALPSEVSPPNSEIADGRAEPTAPNDKTPSGEALPSEVSPPNSEIADGRAEPTGPGNSEPAQEDANTKPPDDVNNGESRSSEPVQPDLFSSTPKTRRRKSNAAKQSTSSGTIPEIRKVALSSILEHPEAQEYRNDLGVNKLWGSPARLLNAEGLRAQIEVMPPHVIEIRGRFLCFSGLRLLQEVKSKLPGSEEILVLVHPASKKDKKGKIQRAVFLEMVIDPVSFGLDKEEEKACLSAFEKILNDEKHRAIVQALVVCPKRKQLAEALHLSESTVRDFKLPSWGAK